MNDMTLNPPQYSDKKIFQFVYELSHRMQAREGRGLATFSSTLTHIRHLHKS